MKDILSKILGSSPRTTIISIIGAIVYALVQVNPQNIEDWRTWIMPVIIIAFGRLAKDSNGITRQESKVVHAVVKEKVIADEGQITA